MKDHVAIVIRNKEGKVLFIQRSFLKKILPGAWAVPSGTKEPNESIFETVKRESFEELGIDVTPNRLLVDLDIPEFKTKLHFVECSLGQEIPKIMQPHEIENMDWLTIDDFFNKFTDDEIGHGLAKLREDRHLLEANN